MVKGTVPPQEPCSNFSSHYPPTNNGEYYTLMSSIGVGVSKHLIDPYFTIIWANDYFYENIQYSRDEYDLLYHNRYTDYLANYIEDLKKWETAIFEARHKNRKNFDVICRMPQKSGSYIWVKISGTFTGELMDSYPIICTVFTDITNIMEQSPLHDALMRKSYYDTLTGLYNRNRFMEDIETYSKSTESIGVIYVDINGLKRVNDLYGHQSGDRILTQSANLLKESFPHGLIYRIGGDEFIIFQPRITKSELEQYIKQAKRNFLSFADFHAAMGWIWTEDGSDLEHCISLADNKMYKDKMEYYRKNPLTSRYRHNADFMFSLSDKDTLLKQIKGQHFQIYLQPKVDLQTHQLIGAEALSRYFGKDGILIPPDQFVPAMEEARTISFLDFFVFDTVCRMISRWLESGLKAAPVSVNFSRYTVASPSFTKTLQSIWEKYRFSKQLLEIEIIENEGTVESEFLARLISEIKKEGFPVSIDDFGAKYSNIVLFTNADIDSLKLDRSLVKGLENNKKTQLLIQSLAQICHALNISIIVEGVETQEQFKILADLCCDGAQGYFISKPIPINEFEGSFLNNSESSYGI